MKIGKKHTPAPLPPSEEQRRGCLCETGVLDSDHEERFDDITQLLAQIFKVPIALVSIVDAERQWFKSVVGLPVRQTPRNESFCAWTMVSHVAQVLVVPNAPKDARFTNNPLVTGDPNIRFYGGSPIIAKSGHRLGSLCIIDKVPRYISSEACIFLGNMADIVAREIEDPRGKVNNTTAIMLLDSKSTTLSTLYVNTMFLKNCSVAKDDVVGKPLLETFTPLGGVDAGEANQKIYDWTHGGKDDLSLDVTCPAAAKKFKLIFRSTVSEILFDDSFVVGAPLGVDLYEAEEQDIGHNMVFVVLEPLEGEIPASGQKKLQSARKSVPTDIVLGMPIGKGSYATVYRGSWTGIEVAVKVLPSAEIIAEEGYDPINEAKLVQSLSHPNLVTVYHCEEQILPNGDKEVWMCQELCKLGTLSSNYQNGFFRLPEKEWSLDMKKVLKVALEIASAMDYIHSKNIVHSDLTTNNVLLQADGKDGFVCKVADFGIAQVLEKDQEYAITESHGTVTHMAPELLMDCKLSKSADVYSFGMLLWEIFHCRRPFEGMIHAQIIAHVALKDVRPDIDESMPGEYRRMVEDCWTAEDEERPSFEELKQRIVELQQKF